jgi:F420-0:gamma-glutamyl ligase
VRTEGRHYRKLHGWVCANHVDESNSIADDIAIVLPKDIDASARSLRLALQERRGVTLGHHH